MALTLVLSVGLDAMLLSSRNFTLQSAGYFVVPAFSLKEAVDLFRNGDFDLVLLCQSIPAQERDRLTLWIRASGSRIPVVVVSGNLCERDAFTDATIDSESITLLTGIKEVLINAAAVHERQDAPTAPGKKPSKSSRSHDQLSRVEKERSASFARAG